MADTGTVVATAAVGTGVIVVGSILTSWLLSDKIGKVKGKVDRVMDDTKDLKDGQRHISGQVSHLQQQGDTDGFASRVPSTPVTA